MKNSYKSIDYKKSSLGFTLFCDGKSAYTPSANALTVPSRELADTIIEEWRNNGNRSIGNLGFTKIVCAAIDLSVASELRPALHETLLAYADTDLLCYRAGGNPVLSHEQSQSLDPLLRWAQKRFSIGFAVTDGLMPVAQPPENKQKLAQALQTYDSWRIAALAACIKPLGSLILALALIEKRLDGEEAFQLAHLEEMHEARQWGRDEEKEKRLMELKREIEAAEKFLSLLPPAAATCQAETVIN